MKKYLCGALVAGIVFTAGFFINGTVCSPETQTGGKTYSGVYIADFDGDKIPDTLKLLKNLRKKDIAKEWVVCNPFGEDTAAEVEPFSILVKLSKDNKTRFLHDSAYFDTPGWASGDLPFEIIKKGDSKFRQWKKDVKSLNSAAIVLGTEAGIDILLYWNKNKFKVFWPNEEP